MTDSIRIGVIGGSGLYRMKALQDVEEHDIDTPFGKPSDKVVTGTIAGQKVAFIPRHGRGHVLNPTEVPYRNNIYALKALGVKYLIGVSACGSLREEYAPGHVVIPDQLIDFTKGKREVTFFENGLVSHIGVADPFCVQLRPLLADAVAEAGGTVHRQGKFITIEGPRFSTRGESHLFRSWGMDIIGMTTSPEAFLAREAEICYAVMAHVTDYDVWHETEEEVTVEMVIKAFQQNLELAQNALEIVIPKVAALQEAASAHSALKSSLTTSKTHVSDKQREKLKPFLKNLLGEE